jgi:hypothetical protein
MSIYAMLTNQGTAAKETAICTACLCQQICDGKCLIPVPDDVTDTTVHNCSGNDELECNCCGAKK